jgi:hypothetical protein
MITAATRFGGTCQACQRWCTYTPLAPRGRSRAYAPGSDQMGVTCRGCGGKVTLDADAGQSPRQPLILDRGSLDLSALRRHVREQHSHAAIRGIPRSNTDLAAWHFREHGRYQPGHRHFGPFVLVRNSRGSTTGQTPRPMGWFTGQDVKTREQLAAEWHERFPRSAS